MRTLIVCSTFLVLTGCKQSERCGDSTSDTGYPTCAEDFTAEPGDACDVDEDTPCMNGSVMMRCSDGTWTGVVHRPLDEDCGS